MDSIKYCNEVMARLETLMFQELSGMAYWKCEFVGADFIRSKNIQGKNVPEIVESCVKEMKAAGIVSDITYKTSPDGLMLKLKVKNCIHHSQGSPGQGGRRCSLRLPDCQYDSGPDS